MKILYIEDELSKNIPRIIRLFDRYLHKEDINKLEALEKDESGYGAPPEEIKKIVEKSNIIDVEYRFPCALEKVIQYHKRYKLFIIDRNLSEFGYTLEEVQQIDPEYSGRNGKTYYEREGDYIYLKIGQFSHGKALSNTYFFTAYSVEDELRCLEQISDFTEREQWRSQIKNFIEKGNHYDLRRLLDEVINIVPLGK